MQDSQNANTQDTPELTASSQSEESGHIVKNRSIIKIKEQLSLLAQLSFWKNLPGNLLNAEARDFKRYPVTISLFWITVIVYYFWEGYCACVGTLPNLSQSESIRLQLIGAMISKNFWSGEYWRPLTSIFMHANSLHLLFNMLALRALAPELEEEYGGKLLLAVYLFIGIVAALAIALQTNSAGVGASGAIMGLWGIELAYKYKLWKLLNLPRIKNQIVITSYLAIIQLVFLDHLIPNIGWSIHLAGFALGLFVGTVLPLSHATKKLSKMFSFSIDKEGSPSLTINAEDREAAIMIMTLMRKRYL